MHLALNSMVARVLESLQTRGSSHLHLISVAQGLLQIMSKGLPKNLKEMPAVFWAYFQESGSFFCYLEACEMALLSRIRFNYGRAADHIGR